MNKRYSWFSVGWREGDFREVSDAMVRNVYRPGHDQGFQIDRRSESSVEGRYVEKIEGERTFEGPSGETIKEPFVRFNVVNFNLSKTFPQLEIVDPPRTVKGLTNFISEKTGFRVSIESSSVPLELWFQQAEADCGNLEIVKAEFTNIVLDQKASAKIIASGAGDVRDALSRLLDGRAYEWDKISVSHVNKDGVVLRATISKRGYSAASSDDAALELVPLLKESFCKVWLKENPQIALPM